jgi:predicted metal-dependent hydrolase
MSELPENFLCGVELFNAGKFFECHEAWEVVWLTADGEEREFLHAMIQAAAALHHFRRGNLKGARSVAERAVEKLRSCPAMMMRLDVPAFRLALNQFLTVADAPPPHIELKS